MVGTHFPTGAELPRRAVADLFGLVQRNQRLLQAPRPPSRRQRLREKRRVGGARAANDRCCAVVLKIQNVVDIAGKRLHF